MIIDKAVNAVARIYAPFVDSVGTGADPDTDFLITIYPANSSTPTVSATTMTKLSTGLYFYVFTPANVGNFTAYFEFTDGGLDKINVKDITVIDTGTAVGASLSADVAAIKTDSIAILVDTAVMQPLISAYVDAKISTAGEGSGDVSKVITVTEKDSGEPLNGILIWLTSNSDGTGVVSARKRTNDFGKATFYGDSGSTYYIFSDQQSTSLGTQTF